MAFNLKELVNLIPNFEGKSEELEGFLSIVDCLYTEVAEADKAKFVLFTKVKFRGKALEAIQENATVRDWPTLRKLLKEKLKSTVQNIELTKLQFSSISQFHNENLQEYTERVKNLFLLLNKSVPVDCPQELSAYIRKENDSIAKRAFEDGLLDINLARNIVAADLTTFQEAVNFAKKMDFRFNVMTSDQITEQSFRSNFRPNLHCDFCDYCEISGHKEINCRKKFKTNNSFSTGQNFHEKRQPIHYESNEQKYYASDYKTELPNRNFSQDNRYTNNDKCVEKSRIICFNCNEPGHIASYCQYPIKNDEE